MPSRKGGGAHEQARDEEDILLETLHPLERKVLPLLASHTEVKELQEASGLQEVEVIRALQWLSNKKVVTEPVKTYTEIVELDELGRRYLTEGLPERRFLEAARANAGVAAISSSASLSGEEVNLCLGLLRKKAAITITKGGEGLVVGLTPQGEGLIAKESFEEQLLKSLAEGPRQTASLKDVERFALDELRKRKAIVRLRTEWRMTVALTPLGEALIRKSSSGVSSADIIEALTPEMLREGSWKEKRFRRYDVSINVPAVYPGKRHFVSQAIEYARRIWLDLGFKEMAGPLLQPTFWNFDALFTAQDHPVREMQDTFYIRQPGTSSFPDKALVERVRKVHESGAGTGSTGWRYAWNPAEAKKNVLRTHTTVTTIRHLAARKARRHG